MSHPVSGDPNAIERSERGQLFEQASRRQSERFEYHGVVGICHYNGESPPPSEFRETRARDISSNGLAFYWPERPPSGPLVLAFGDLENPILVLADVVWCERGWFDGRKQYLVRCLMTGRLNEAGDR